MILIKRMDLTLKNPKEKLVALFAKTAIDEATDTTVQEQLPLSSEEWNEETANAVKRLLGFPITKQLIYLSKIGSNWKQYPIESWEIVKEYGEWCELQISVKELGKIKIHHTFLSEMQKPNFKNEYEESFKSIED